MAPTNSASGCPLLDLTLKIYQSTLNWLLFSDSTICLSFVEALWNKFVMCLPNNKAEGGAKDRRESEILVLGLVLEHCNSEKP